MGDNNERAAEVVHQALLDIAAGAAQLAEQLREASTRLKACRRPADKPATLKPADDGANAYGYTPDGRYVLDDAPPPVGCPSGAGKPSACGWHWTTGTPDGCEDQQGCAMVRDCMHDCGAFEPETPGPMRWEGGGLHPIKLVLGGAVVASITKEGDHIVECHDDWWGTQPSTVGSEAEAIALVIEIGINHDVEVPPFYETEGVEWSTQGDADSDGYGRLKLTVGGIYVAGVWTLDLKAVRAWTTHGWGLDDFEAPNLRAAVGEIIRRAATQEIGVPWPKWPEPEPVSVAATLTDDEIRAKTARRVPFGGRHPGARCGCGGTLHLSVVGVLDCDSCPASYRRDGRHWCPGCETWPERWTGGTDSDPRPDCDNCMAPQPGWPEPVSDAYERIANKLGAFAARAVAAEVAAVAGATREGEKPPQAGPRVRPVRHSETGERVWLRAPEPVAVPDEEPDPSTDEPESEPGPVGEWARVELAGEPGLELAIGGVCVSQVWRVDDAVALARVPPEWGLGVHVEAPDIRAVVGKIISAAASQGIVVPEPREWPVTMDAIRQGIRQGMVEAGRCGRCGSTEHTECSREEDNQTWAPEPAEWFTYPAGAELHLGPLHVVATISKGGARYFVEGHNEWSGDGKEALGSIENAWKEVVKWGKGHGIEVPPLPVEPPAAVWSRLTDAWYELLVDSEPVVCVEGGDGGAVATCLGSWGKATAGCKDLPAAVAQVRAWGLEHGGVEVPPLPVEPDEPEALEPAWALEAHRIAAEYAARFGGDPPLEAIGGYAMAGGTKLALAGLTEPPSPETWAAWTEALQTAEDEDPPIDWHQKYRGEPTSEETPPEIADATARSLQ